VRLTLAIGLLIHGCWSVFSLTQVFKPRADWAQMRRKLVALDLGLASFSFWAVAELLAGRNARVPLALLGALVLLLIPLPCYFGAVNRRRALVALRNLVFAAIAAALLAIASGLVIL
jgi:heme/copper-type cytochrome/quinol oxidase subunit 4